MPNRIIKESTFTSDKISGLSDFQFRLWVGLITQADDAGRGDARPAIIKGRVFPLRDRVTVKDIDSALHALAAGGCISLYTVGGKSYYRFPSWAEHQRVRDAKPKYPGPEDGEIMTVCGESRRVAASCGELRPESNPIQSESISESESNKGAGRADRSPLEIALDDFAAARKAMKKPLTDKARELTKAKLEELAPGDEAMQVAILNQSIQRGWQGVFALKEAEKPKGKSAKQWVYDAEHDDVDRLTRMLAKQKGEV